MKVAFRVDSSIVMGVGHVMRCLTLADKLKDNGAMSIFIMRNHDGNISAFVKSKGYDVHLLAESDSQYGISIDDSNYGWWLGSSSKSDAEETISAIDTFSVDWLVVDHYAIDELWERELRSHVENIMIIDDLANRRHDCDLLLDQTYGREKADYENFVDSECQLLLGSQFSLLRNEFIEARVKVAGRRGVDKGINRILVALGGTDPDNVTETVLKGISKSNADDTVVIDVLLGNSSPYKGDVEKLVRELFHKATLSIDANDVAERMSIADISIGSGGTTSWERCCVGLPAMVIVNADNQNKIVEELSKTGAVISLGSYSSLSENMVASCLNDLISSPERLKNMSHKAMQVTDGSGTDKVAKAMMGYR